MAELAKKQEYIKSSNVYVLKVNSLDAYLNNYVISKEIFNYDDPLDDSKRNILLRYYDDSKEKADRLVIEDEFVGITYDNLDIIKNKLIKKM